MTTTSPTGEPAAPEQVGLALRAVAAGICGGTGATGLALHAVRSLQAHAPAAAVPVTTGLVPNLIITGWLGGSLIAAVIAWLLMAPIASSYRRGAFAMVASFAALAAALVTMPADAMFGRPGLLAVAAIGLAGSILLGRSAKRQGS